MKIYNGFVKETSTFCAYNEDGTIYSNLGLAISTCREDQSCYAVQDDYCDAKGAYKTCHELGMIKKGGLFGTCIYRKVLGRHMYLKQVLGFIYKIYVNQR